MLPTLMTVVVAWFAVAAVPYLVLEHRWRWRWQEVEDGQAPAHSGAMLYREPGSIPIFLREAPLSLRLSAFSCLLFGTLLLPGLAICALGLFFFGMGLVLVPILITAGKLYRAGLLLLKREPRTAYFAARNAAAWSLWCIAFGLIACVITLYCAFDWGLLVFMAGAALTLSGQAWLMLRAVERHQDTLFAGSRLVRLGSHWVATDSAA
jgi:hypothetical protein